MEESVAFADAYGENKLDAAVDKLGSVEVDVLLVEDDASSL